MIPTVSVIIPTYNRAHLIGRAIESVLSQTYNCFEIIIVDDASVDGTERVFKNHSDKRIRYIRSDKNMGPAGARNIGIESARGKYIAFLDSDDEWLPEKLKKQIRVFERSSDKIGVVYTATLRKMDHGEFLVPSSDIKQKEGNLHNLFLCGKYLVPTPSAAVKKECFDRLGMFDVNLPAIAELDLWIRISKFYHFMYVDETLVISHYTPNSMATYLLNNCRATWLILKKHFNEIKKNKKALIHFIYLLMRGYVSIFFRKIRFMN